MSCQTIIVSAPGKVIVHGEHAVVYGKVSFCVALWNYGKRTSFLLVGVNIAMFRVMSPFVINVSTRDLLVPYTKRPFQIRVGTLALQLQCL